MPYDGVGCSPMRKKEVLSLLDCSVCKHPFTEPKLLPCQHTFCLTCLEKVGSEARSGDKMLCPFCSETFFVPAVSAGGFASLKSNFFVEKLLEINKISVCAVKPCQMCMDKRKLVMENRGSHNNISKKPPVPNKRSSMVHARYYCTDCEKNICSDCANEHAIHCKNHKLAPLESPSPVKSPGEDSGASRFRPNSCSHHKNEQLRWHCRTCTETVCTLCREKLHQNHACDDVVEVHEKFRLQLQDDINKVSERLPERLLARTAVDQHIIRVQNQVHHLNSEIEAAGELLKQQIDHMTRTLCENLSTIQQQRLKELKQIGSGIDKDISILEGFLDYTMAIKDKGTPCDVSRSVKDLSDRAEKLSRQKFEDCTVALSSFHVKFEPAVKPLQKNGHHSENLVGAIVVSDHGQPTTNTIQNGYSKNHCNIKATRLTRLDTDKRYVIGLGQLSSRLYVICGCSNSIQVYDVNQNYKTLDIIKLSKLKDPVDLVCSSASNCLYVTDSGNSCVWRVAKFDKNGLGGKAVKWLSDISWPYKVSVTQDGRILILSWTPAALNIYSPDAILQRSVSLPTDLVEPQNAVETTIGTFIVTHGGTNNQVHQVVEVDQNGQTLQAFGEGRGFGPDQLDLPCHMAVDHLGRIFVADYNNSRVMMLTAPFRSNTRAQVLVSWAGDSMKEPRRVAFVQSNPIASNTGLGSGSAHTNGFLKGNEKSALRSSRPLEISVPANEFGRLYVGLGGAVDVYSLTEDQLYSIRM